MERVILHLDIDAFFVSVERRARPWLRGRPVAVGGDPARRGVVASASYEARERGVRAAMPLALAKRLCPDCVFLPARFDDYAAASEGLVRTLGRFTPDMEPLSMEEAFLDLTGCRRLLGRPLAAAERIRMEVKGGLGLDATIGVASNKLVARVASALAKPNGICRVLPGAEEAFLAPLPVRVLPGVGPRAEERLRLLGAATVGELRRLDGRILAAALGPAGSRLAEAARGEDGGPVAPRGEAKSIGRETTFPADTLDRERILAELSALAAEACRALREAGRRSRTVTLKLRHADFTTVTRSAPLPEPTDLDAEVFAAAAGLLGKAWTRRLKVRLVGVRLSGIEGGGRQSFLPMGGPDRERLRRLYAAMDRVRARHGDGAIAGGAALLRRTGGRLQPIGP
ncbi:MAG: DNA polymerase IV [Candidatus Aureabacteria bacterium]|nr:DNA polymerase IV [Candidatus Auribacterota bacterium]